MFTLMRPCLPGGTCFADSKATLQPHVGLMSSICTVLLAVLVKVNTCVSVSPSNTDPKSFVSVSNTITGLSGA
jgi:hypothetical protein